MACKWTRFAYKSEDVFFTAFSCLIVRFRGECCSKGATVHTWWGTIEKFPTVLLVFSAEQELKFENSSGLRFWRMNSNCYPYKLCGTSISRFLNRQFLLRKILVTRITKYPIIIMTFQDKREQHSGERILTLTSLCYLWTIALTRHRARE